MSSVPYDSSAMSQVSRESHLGYPTADHANEGSEAGRARTPHLSSASVHSSANIICENKSKSQVKTTSEGTTTGMLHRKDTLFDEQEKCGWILLQI